MIQEFYLILFKKKGKTKSHIWCDLCLQKGYKVIVFQGMLLQAPWELSLLFCF